MRGPELLLRKLTDILFRRSEFPDLIGRVDIDAVLRPGEGNATA
jgi:hypothetical protein